MQNKKPIDTGLYTTYHLNESAFINAWKVADVTITKAELASPAVCNGLGAYLAKVVSRMVGNDMIQHRCRIGKRRT
jgi:hypothetical protein